MSQFDPYYLWLGIPPQEQPPNFYRLLGIVMFESNRDVIETAADRQMTFLRQYGIGPHSEASQKLLNEVSEARLVLLNVTKKSAYDERLKTQIDQEIAAEKSDRPIPIDSAAESRSPPAGSRVRAAPGKANPTQRSASVPAAAPGRTARRQFDTASPSDEAYEPLPFANVRPPRTALPERSAAGRKQRRTPQTLVLPWAAATLAVGLVLALVVFLMRGGQPAVDPRLEPSPTAQPGVPEVATTSPVSASQSETAAISSTDAPTTVAPFVPPMAVPEDKAVEAPGSEVLPEREALVRLLPKLSQDSSVHVTMLPVGASPGRSLRLQPQDAVPDQPLEVMQLHLFPGGTIVPSDLALAMNFPRLNVVNLRGPGWTGRELQFLRGHPGIAGVHYNHHGAVRPVACEAFPHLHYLPALKQLTLDSTAVSDANIPELARLDRLEFLTLSISRLSAAGFSGLGQMQRLHSLSLRGQPGSSGPSDEDLAVLASLPNLQTLNLSYVPNFSGTRLGPRGAFPALRSLSVIGASRIDERGLEIIAAAAPNLAFLDINAPAESLTAAGLKPLVELQSLRNLRLSTKTSIGDEGIAYILQMPNLTELFLPGSRVTDTGIETLAKHPKIAAMDLSATAITDEACRHLAGMEQLTNFTFNRTQVTDEGIRRFVKRKTPMRRMQFTGNISRAIIDELRKAHPTCEIHGP